MNLIKDNQTLYEKLGGEPAIEAATEIFYKRVLNDPSLNYFFEEVDMETQQKHMQFYLAYAFGAVASYTGKNMRESHQHLVDEMGLNNSHFDAVLEHMQASLTSLEVPDDLLSEVHDIMESTRQDILAGSSGGV